MRIVVWNCARGPLTTKLAALDTLHADISILSEAPPPPEENDQVLWFPSEAPSLGVQVRTRGPYKLQRLPHADLPNCVNPVKVLCDTPFTLLAVWTWPAPTYVKAFVNALDAYGELIANGPTVIAGDFNGNPTFDKPRQWVKWGNAFSRLNQLGVVSAYHHVKTVEYGKEQDPTHHFQRKVDRPFHIDYCFVPVVWTKVEFSARVESGTLWSSISDHFPIVVETAAD